MAWERPSKLVLLQFHRRQSDLSYPISAHIADLNPKGELKEIVFQQQIEIKPWEKDRCFINDYAAATYNYSINEMTFACFGRPTEYYLDDDQLAAKVWRIGEYASFIDSEDSTFMTMYKGGSSGEGDLPATLSIMLDPPVSGTTPVIIASCMGRSSTAFGPHISRKGLDGKWSMSPIRYTDETPWTVSDAETDRGSRLVFAPRESAVYAHFIVKQGCYSVKLDYLKKMVSDKPVAWQYCTLDLGPSLSKNLSNSISLVVSNELANRHRLYFFEEFITADSKSEIQYSYLPLRKDGSLDATGKAIQSQGRGSIPLPKPAHPGRLTGVVWKKKIILLSELDDCSWASICEIDKDGGVPDWRNWKQSAVRYEDGSSLDTFKQHGALVVTSEAFYNSS